MPSGGVPVDGEMLASGMLVCNHGNCSEDQSSCTGLSLQLISRCRTQSADLPLVSCMVPCVRCRVTGMTTAKPQSDREYIHAPFCPSSPPSPCRLLQYGFRLPPHVCALPHVQFKSLRVCVCVFNRCLCDTCMLCDLVSTDS